MDTQDSGGRPETDSRKSGKPRSRHDVIFGAIDLGTNNCRMLMARRASRGFRVVESFSRIVRLGEGLGASGVLSDEAMDRAVEALGICAQKLQRRNVTRMRAVATQACRMASNGREFLDRVERETGLVLDMISPEEEARLAVQGSLDLLDDSFEAAVVVDIGGGSTELCWLDLAEWRARGGYPDAGRPGIRGWTTIPLGVVTLSERCPEPANASTAERAAWYEAMKAEVRKETHIPKGARRLRALFEAGKAHMVGTSGTVTSIAGVHLDLVRYDRNRVDGLWMTHDEARKACDRLSTKDAAGRAGEGCIGTERADLVVAGCAILETVMDGWPVPRLRVGDRGLREGLLLNLIYPRRKRGRRGRKARSRQAASSGDAA
ncbi:MAG: Ppx/GppA phosphatase family protein [Caulobacterales bacterium]|uniref:Ppx/GppA phosphatase family protein n=1 Tax=Glycocaulis sp. TaxID=1969725 RepID=UPI003F9F03A3